jgi:hypothetical protein
MHTIEIESFGARVAKRIKFRVALGITIPQSMYTISDLLKSFFYHIKFLLLSWEFHLRII